MGKRSEAQLTIDAWDTFLGMKFNAKNGIGWSFPGNTTDFEIEDAVMEYALKKLWVHVLIKLQQWSSILILSYLPR